MLTVLSFWGVKGDRRIPESHWPTSLLKFISFRSHEKSLFNGAFTHICIQHLHAYITSHMTHTFTGLCLYILHIPYTPIPHDTTTHITPHGYTAMHTYTTSLCTHHHTHTCYTQHKNIYPTPHARTQHIYNSVHAHNSTPYTQSKHTQLTHTAHSTHRDII